MTEGVNLFKAHCVHEWSTPAPILLMYANSKVKLFLKGKYINVIYKTYVFPST
jgi:hypothetical protein